MDSSMRLSIQKKRLLFISEAIRKKQIDPVPKNLSYDNTTTPAKAGKVLFPVDDINRILYPDLFTGKY